MIIRVISELEAVGKPRMTQRDKWAQRPCVMRYWDFKDKLMASALKQRYRPEMDVYCIDASVFLPMPDSWSKAKCKQHEGQPHRQKPDADNILKGICDALLKDDSGVWDKRIMKFWSTNPKVDLIIYYD